MYFFLLRHKLSLIEYQLNRQCRVMKKVIIIIKINDNIWFADYTSYYLRKSMNLIFHYSIYDAISLCHLFIVSRYQIITVRIMIKSYFPIQLLIIISLLVVNINIAVKIWGLNFLLTYIYLQPNKAKHEKGCRYNIYCYMALIV